MAFPDSFIDELIQKNDIEELVSGYTQLSGSGQRKFGLCPFHSEKTASFSVSADKQLYYCFGCGKGGGVINFIMEIENLDYPDAVRFLADRAGIQAPEDGGNWQAGLQNKRILEMNQLAAKYYHASLYERQGARALDYLTGRGLSKGIITRFGLGYAPDSWDGLIQELAKSGFEKSDLLIAGLAAKNRDSTSIYDRFRNRVMFPIIDVRGNVIGFGGRVMDDSLPKYLNSPDTPVFNKSRNLFALNIAKKSKQGRIILTEGYMDAIALHQAGFDCAVASLGTALTQEHAKLLSRYGQVVIAYDSDEAGSKAAQRAIGILSNAGIKIQVLRMNGAKDPDEFVRKNGAKAFENLLNRSENHIEYRLMNIRNQYDLNVDEQRLSYMRQATELIASLNSAVEREIYTSRVAEAASVSAEALALEVKKALKKRFNREQKKSAAPAVTIQPKERALRYGNVKSARAEEGVIKLISNDPSLLTKCGGLDPELFSSELLGRVYDLLRQRSEQGLSTYISTLEGVVSDEEMKHLITLFQEDLPETNSEKALCDYIAVIQYESGKQNMDSDEALMALREAKKRETAHGG